MEAQAMVGCPVLVLTADPELLDQVLSVTATVGVEPRVAADAAAARADWSTAGVVLVGVDRAADAAALGAPRRAGVLVVGDEQTRTQVHQWSVPLGAAVVTLPDGASLPSTLIADAGGRSPVTSRRLVVVGGAGGVGASTLAAGLALGAARGGRSTMLVDTDARAGGLDLLLGAERVQGWRWPRLASARGHLGNLGGQLPSVDGLDVLAMARGERPGREPRAEQLAAVVASAGRSHGLVVLDVPRHLPDTVREAVAGADVVLLVARADVRGVAAAREVRLELDELCPSVGLVVRTGRVRGLDAETVADGLELDLWARLADEPTLALSAERGDPPGRAPRSALSGTCRLLLERLDHPGAPT